MATSTKNQTADLSVEGIQMTAFPNAENEPNTFQVQDVVDQGNGIDVHPASPYAWPSWKKDFNLVLVAFHAMTTTLTASSIIPAYEPIAERFHKSVQDASYLTSAHILVLGLAPLFWKPISQRYGRRPVFILSTFCAALFNVGCALSKSYEAMMVCRVFNAFFISPPMGIGGAVVTEMFFAKQRGQKMGIWTLMVTLGPPVGPFIFGFVTYHASWEWIYWTLAILNGVQCVVYFIFASETRCVRTVDEKGITSSIITNQSRYKVKRIDPTPMTVAEAIEPITIGRHIDVLLPAIAYAVTFGFASVLVTVEIPQTYIPTFGLNPQQIGLQFLAIIIGSVLGELAGGPLSDWWMTRNGGRAAHRAEWRLWISWAGFLLAMIGLLVFGVQLGNATPMQWNVTPDIGAAIAAFGNQLVTTVLTTYAIDRHAVQSGSVSSFISVVRQTWGFIGPFWFPDMFSSIGYAGSGGLMAGLIFGAAWCPVIFLQLRRRGIAHDENGMASA